MDKGRIDVQLLYASLMVSMWESGNARVGFLENEADNSQMKNLKSQPWEQSLNINSHINFARKH